MLNTSPQASSHFDINTVLLWHYLSQFLSVVAPRRTNELQQYLQLTEQKSASEPEQTNFERAFAQSDVLNAGLLSAIVQLLIALRTGHWLQNTQPLVSPACEAHSLPILQNPCSNPAGTIIDSFLGQGRNFIS